MKEYRVAGYRRSHRKGKKYDAILKNIASGKLAVVPFGALGYQQYRDSTPLGLYTSGDHADLKRRRLYRQRHAKDLRTGYYSPGYFSYYKLW
jgi:hypothetical protein